MIANSMSMNTYFFTGSKQKYYVCTYKTQVRTSA